MISHGGSPDMWSDDGLAGITEYRAGTYAYFDRSLATRGTCSFDDCALSVLATVVSTPVPGRALIDAGSKALTIDLLGLKHYGIVRALGDAPVYELNEEHGYLDTSAAPSPPRIGDLVRITPNHVCPVSISTTRSWCCAARRCSAPSRWTPAERFSERDHRLTPRLAGRWPRPCPGAGLRAAATGRGATRREVTMCPLPSST